MSDSEKKKGMPELGVRLPDRLAASARGLLGGLPYVGPAIAEALAALIPNQRIDRNEDWLRLFAERMSAAAVEDQQRAAERIRGSAEAIGLVEDTLAQAARATSEDRRRYLASMLANGLTAEPFRSAESEKMLRLLADLMDEEVLFLAYWGMQPSIGGQGPGGEFYRRHESTLRPASRQVGAPPEEAQRAALHDSYYHTLSRMGLVLEGAQGPAVKHLTPLGKLLLRYIEASDEALTEGK